MSTKFVFHIWIDTAITSFILLSNWISKGVTGKLLSWIKSYLSDRSIKVVLSGQSSSTSSINASVPQGSILGPILFSVFIDDLGDEIENQLYLYADDSTLFCENKATDDPEAKTASLNRDLERMRIWADRWKVTFEPSKCKAMTISRKTNPTRLGLQFGTTELAEKEELEILGVTIDSKLTWAKHISNISSRAGQRLGALRRVASKLDVRDRATVYKAQVRSVMEYASLSWMSASSTTLGLLRLNPEEGPAYHRYKWSGSKNQAEHYIPPPKAPGGGGNCTI